MTSGDSLITIKYDRDIGNDWLSVKLEVDGEVGKALPWLQKIKKSDGKHAGIIITLTDSRKRLHMVKRHRLDGIAIVDLYISAYIALSKSRSALIRNSLSTALHEATHAFPRPTGSGRERFDEEYRATLVESCYLIDSMRQGDILHLNISATREHAQPYILAQSRKAAAGVMVDLSRVAGSSSVAGSDLSAIKALNKFCNATLPVYKTGL